MRDTRAETGPSQPACHSLGAAEPARDASNGEANAGANAGEAAANADASGGASNGGANAGANAGEAASANADARGGNSDAGATKGADAGANAGARPAAVRMPKGATPGECTDPVMHASASKLSAAHELRDAPSSSSTVTGHGCSISKPEAGCTGGLLMSRLKAVRAALVASEPTQR